MYTQLTLTWEDPRTASSWRGSTRAIGSGWSALPLHSAKRMLKHLTAIGPLPVAWFLAIQNQLGSRKICTISENSFSAEAALQLNWRLQSHGWRHWLKAHSMDFYLSRPQPKDARALHAATFRRFRKNMKFGDHLTIACFIFRIIPPDGTRAATFLSLVASTSRLIVRWLFFEMGWLLWTQRLYTFHSIFQTNTFRSRLVRMLSRALIKICHRHFYSEGTTTLDPL